MYKKKIIIMEKKFHVKKNIKRERKRDEKKKGERKINFLFFFSLSSFFLF